MTHDLPVISGQLLFTHDIIMRGPDNLEEQVSHVFRLLLQFNDAPLCAHLDRSFIKTGRLANWFATLFTNNTALGEESLAEFWAMLMRNCPEFQFFLAAALLCEVRGTMRHDEAHLHACNASLTVPRTADILGARSLKDLDGVFKCLSFGSMPGLTATDCSDAQRDAAQLRAVRKVNAAALELRKSTPQRFVRAEPSTTQATAAASAPGSDHVCLQLRSPARDVRPRPGHQQLRRG